MLANHAREETPLLKGRHTQRVLRHTEETFPDALVTTSHTRAVRGVLSVQEPKKQQAQRRHTAKTRALHDARQEALRKLDADVRVPHWGRERKTRQIRVHHIRQARRDVQVLPDQRPNGLHAGRGTVPHRALRGAGQAMRRGQRRRRGPRNAETLRHVRRQRVLRQGVPQAQEARKIPQALLAVKEHALSEETLNQAPPP